MKAISEGNESQHVWLERRDVCMGGREGDWKDGGQETVEEIGRETENDNTGTKSRQILLF